MSTVHLRFALLFAASGLLLHAAPSAPAEVVAEPEDGETPAPAKPAEDPVLALYWEALKLFRTDNAANLTRGRELLTQGADAENSHAENYLGLATLNGWHGFTRNPRKAATWFTLAAQRGNAFAKINLGLCYFNGTGLRKDTAKAREWLQAALDEKADYSSPRPPEGFYANAAEAGEAGLDTTLSGDLPIDPADRYRTTAHALLGDLCAREKQEARAQEHYVKAATMGEGGRAGLRSAAIRAAINYAFGQGVPRDLAKANEMLEQSKKLSRQEMVSFAHSLVERKRLDDFALADFAEEVSEKTDQQHEQLQLGIAGSFADPKSKNYNPQEAARWFELAAESKQAWAMLSLAFLHHDGRLGKPDAAQAFKWFKDAAEQGNHPLGWANLAICYQNGLGTEKDTAKAEALFKKHREYNLVCYLGTQGQCPATVLKEEQELALLKTLATKKKDPHACYLYGLRSLYGAGMKSSLKGAEEWLTKATKQDYGPAWRELGKLYFIYGGQLRYSPAEAHEAARGCFEKAAEAQDAEGIASLADMYSPPAEKPDGTKPILYLQPDEYRAEALYLRALSIDPENGRAHNNVAVIYAQRFAVAARRFHMRETADFRAGIMEAGDFRAKLAAEDYRAKMLKHYEAAHKAKIPTAALNLGNLHYLGGLGEKNYQTAYTYFEAAASDGQIEARRLLGQMHERGEGVPVTYREAAYHYRLAAIGGDLEALTRLCSFYLQGKGVSKDLDRARMWLEMLARQGRGGALVTLGDIMIERGQHAEAFKFFKGLREYRSSYLDGHAYERMSRLYSTGEGVKADPAKAKAYHEKAVALDNPHALYADAVALIDEKKYEEAVFVLRKAVGAGSSDAEYRLSTLYFNGLGVPENVTLAIKHCRNAAESGNAEAQYSLSVLSLQNVPGAPSLEEAIRFAESAETSGHAAASVVRKKLEEKRDRPAQTAADGLRSL